MRTQPGLFIGCRIDPNPKRWGGRDQVHVCVTRDVMHEKPKTGNENFKLQPSAKKCHLLVVKDQTEIHLLYCQCNRYKAAKYKYI